MNQRGEFEPFKMMIGAIFALLVLTIILSAIDSFEKFRLQVSNEKLSAGLKNAVEQPDGQVLEMENLYFQAKKLFNPRAIERSLGLGNDCVVLKEDPANPYIVLKNGVIELTAKMETKVFAQCYTNQVLGTPNPDCEVACNISFGALQ